MTMLRAIHDRENPYVMITKPAINDKKLSLAARGLLTWLLDKPDDYPIEPQRIAYSNGISVYESKKLLKELSSGGYLVAPDDRAKGDDGKYIQTPYTLRESACIPLNGKPCDETHETETMTSNPAHGNHVMESSAWKSPSGIRTGVKHEIAAEQITKTNNNNKQEQEITTLPPVANPELAAPVTASGSGGGYSIPVLDSVDLWESNATTLPAEIETAARVIRVQSAVSSTPPPVAPPPSPPEVKPLPEQDTAIGRVARDYERYISGLDSRSPDLLQTAIEDFGETAVRAAIEGAFGKNSPWSYALGTLRRQRAAGTLPRSDVPVPALAPAKHAKVTIPPPDGFDLFNPTYAPEPKPEPEPVNSQWRELTDFVQSQNRELYRMHLSQCRYGGFEAGKLTILVPTERIQTGCIWELNHRGAFTKWCQEFWTDLTSVEFVIEGEAHYALPETG